MTTHAAAIVDQLPTLYRDGDLVTALAAVLGLQLEIVDEQARIIQRAHWFDTTVELAEAAALGALLDIAPEPWQQLGEYRAWFDALRTARLEYGAVTVPALQAFTELYVDAFEQTNGMDAVAPFDTWANRDVRIGNALVENPRVRRGVRLGGPGAIEPLAQQEVINGGFDVAPLSALLVGGATTEYVPVLINRTTGEALAYLGELRPGDRLWLTGTADGTIHAQLNRTDATDKLRAISQVSPGQPWSAAQILDAPRAVTLAPGRNELWFLPVAHFDLRGLDRALLALADENLRDGRFDSTSYDEALFYLDPAAYLDIVWDEHPPATVRIDLDAGQLSSPAGKLDAALEARDQLASSVGTGLRKLAAAGVAADVTFRPRYDSQRQLDHLVFISGMQQHEVGTVGADTLADAGGLFGVTNFDESTYQ